MVLADIGNQVQHTLQLLSGHKARRAVGALVGVDQIALLVVCAGFAVPHPHDHENQHTQRRYAATHPVQAVGPAEHGGDTGKEAGIGKLRRGAEGPSRRLPHIVVVKELSDVAAPVEQSAQGDGDDDSQLNQLFSGDRNTLLSYASKSMHWMSTSGQQT